MWFSKSKLKSDEYEDINKLFIKLNAKVEMLDAKICNIEDQIKRSKGRYFREKDPEPSEDSNTQVLVAV